MATQLFLQPDVGGGPFADTHRGTNSAKRDGTASGWIALPLTTARGASSQASGTTATVTGATLGVEVTTSGGVPYEWISPPVAADVTISGTITANIWAEENNMSANVAINVIIDIIRATDNSITNIVQSTRVTEVAVSTRAVNNFTTGMTSGAYTGQTANRGDRIRVRVVGDDVGAMATGFTFTIEMGAASASVAGDTYVTFTENFSFESAPGGSTLYLTNTPVTWGTPAAPALISDFTGSDENPLSEGGNWANLNSSLNPLQRASNAAASSVGSGNSYWTPANFGPDLEAYCTIISGITSAASGINFRIQGEGGAGTWDGYRVVTSNTAVSIQRIDNASVTTLITNSDPTVADGDKVGVRAVGSTIQAWLYQSGTWNLVVTIVDSTYGSAGKIGLSSPGTTLLLDDFYAATNSNLFTQEAWTSRGAGVVSYRSDTDTGWV